MVNEINISARVVSDISLRNTNQKSFPVSDFRVVHKHKKAKNPVFIDVEVWGEEAQSVFCNIKRGDLILISGELRCDSWISRETSEKRNKIKITANKISIINSNNNIDLINEMQENLFR